MRSSARRQSGPGQWRVLGLAAILALGAAAIFAAGPAGAAQSYRVNNATVGYINEWGVCKKVTNSAGLDLFVPTNTAGEWASFYNSPPGGVSVVNCPTWQVFIGQSDGPCSIYPPFSPGGYCMGYDGLRCLDNVFFTGNKYRCQ